MDFFNKLGDSIQNVGKEASKKAKDLSGTVTLNSQIKETETQLERIYKLIGEKYYMAYREEAAERFPEENDELIKLQNKLEEDKKQLRALKGLKVCQNCGAEIELSVLHSPMCGTEQPQIQVQPQMQPAQAFCPGCGAPLAEGAKFCGKCGTKIN